MLHNVPSSDLWTLHLEQRLHEAMEIHLLNSHSYPSLHSTHIFLPDQIDDINFSISDPRQSLRSLIGERLPLETGWIKREDLFMEAAKWLCSTYGQYENAIWLLCEAGYSKVGDKSLEGRSFILHKGRPFLYLKLNKTSTEFVTTVLRWGRSRRFLGTVAQGETPLEAIMGVIRQLFICDAFDGDSMAVMEISSL